jgi:hypothetical protein
MLVIVNVSVAEFGLLDKRGTRLFSTQGGRAIRFILILIQPTSSHK